MAEIKIAELNPRAWGLTLVFKIISPGEVREVNFKDGTVHKVSDVLVGDGSGTILLTVWDDNIKKLKKGRVYEVSEVRMNVFNNRMSANMTRKSKIKEVKKDMKVNTKTNVSEKRISQEWIPRKKFKR